MIFKAKFRESLFKRFEESELYIEKYINKISRMQHLN
jgi:hypothetical protein